MNFKNITKIAAATALLFASTSIFAMPEDSLYLHIQNNSDLNFNITQIKKENRNFALSAINARSSIDINQLPWSYDYESVANGVFNLTTEDKNTQLRLKTAHVKSENKFRAMLNLVPGGAIAENEKPITGTDNEFHVFLTLAGNKENNFAGSSIEVKAGIPKA